MEQLEQLIGYSFKNRDLLTTALTHSSYANEAHQGECNERMEFLGDAVLSVIVSRYIFDHYTQKQEGELTKLRASLVCESTLAGFSQQIHLGEFLRLGNGERHSGGAERPSILADAFEALLAAIFLDGGMDRAREFVMNFAIAELEHPTIRRGSDYKTQLQEIVQSSGDHLEYFIVSESGPDHNKHYVAEVRLNSNVIGKGGGRSKKEAEQQSARDALRLFGE